MNYDSILENGHMVGGAYPVGTKIETQWGPRKVVSVVASEQPPADHITLGEIATGVQ